MGVVPPAKSDFLTFCETRVPVWQAAATSIGLTSAQVGGMDAATKDLREKQLAAEAARNASKAATLTYGDADGTLREMVSVLVRTIKLHADNSANPGAVYAAAQISPPAAPTAMPPPGQPTNFTFELEAGGLLTMRWKSTNSAASTGGSFRVARRFGGEVGGLFNVIGATSSKVFTDDSIPLGVGSVSYILTPMRNGIAGTASDIVTVQFGVGGLGRGSQMSVTGAPNAGYQIAA